MLDFYYAATPNGQKLLMFLEETGLAHRRITVSLSKGEQFAPEFLRISPNNKIPAMVDHAPADGGAPLPLFESGAMLHYLAEKTGFGLPQELRARAEVLQWLSWQMAGLGPMAGQAGFFNVYAPEPVPYAIERYRKEVARLYGVLDKQLAGRAWIAGKHYSIADIACYPWIVPHAGHGQDLHAYPNLKRWFRQVSERPATRRAYAGVEDVYARRGHPIPAEPVSHRGVTPPIGTRPQPLPGKLPGSCPDSGCDPMGDTSSAIEAVLP